MRLETERLVLRRWVDKDIEPYVALCADPEVMRYIGYGSTRTREQSIKAIEGFEHNFDDRGYSAFCVADRGTDECLGFCGFLVPDFLPEVMPAVEIGWRLSRASWGRGLATEAAEACMDWYGNSGFDWDPLVAICHVDNRASERVMQKVGFRLWKETREPGADIPVKVYRYRK